jgi:tetratricopeptide (TPR) repeat protein
MNVKLTARCTVIVAAAGYGKSAAVRRWLGDQPAQWCSGTVPREVQGAWLVVDDVFTTAEDELLRLLENDTRLVLIGRWPLDTLGRLARHGMVEERGAADLALTAEQTAEVLREYGVSDPTVAATVHQRTGGWPALVRLAGQAGRDRRHHRPGVGVRGPARADADAGPDGETAARPRPPRDARRRAVPRAGPPAPRADAGATATHRRHRERNLVPVVVEAARDRWPLPPAERARLFRTAADWYAAHHRPGDAITAYAQCGRWDEAASLLRTYGPEWVIGGGAATITATIDALPHKDPALRLLLGEALLIRGEDDRALTELTALADTEELEAGLAWRLGAVHYLRADPRTAMTTFARARDPENSGKDGALLLAWDATARWMSGDAAACGELAPRALAAAERAGDDRARAAAHVALSMHAMLTGDRSGNASHLNLALRCAEAAGDIVQAARVHGNLAARLLEDAQYEAALAEARRSKELAEATGYTAILAVAWCNEADALFRLGRLDEAAAAYEQALTTFQQRRSHKVAYPLIGLGGIHRARGRHSLARAAYEEAARAASATGDVQGMVPALAGLARVLASIDPAAAWWRPSGPAPPDPDRTRRSPHWPPAGPSWGPTTWRRRAGGDRGRHAGPPAPRHPGPGRGAGTGRGGVDRDNDVAAARRALAEAVQTWRLANARSTWTGWCARSAGCPTPAWPSASPPGWPATGWRRPGSRCPTSVPAWPPRRVVIRTLGRFEVCVGDTAVTMSMWQSRKARDLLRVLVARRGPRHRPRRADRAAVAGGRPGPAGPPAVGGTVHCALRARSRPAADPDHYVLADRSGVALETGSLTIDLELFLAEVSHGLALRDVGRCDDARSVLATAESRYTGDFLENEPYEDWSVAAREEARAAYLRTVRTLAELSRHSGRVDDAVHYLLRVIDKDPYDEAGHRELVATLATAGRHGESRRARARYVAAMHDIGVDPSP